MKKENGEEEDICFRALFSIFRALSWREREEKERWVPSVEGLCGPSHKAGPVVVVVEVSVSSVSESSPDSVHPSESVSSPAGSQPSVPSEGGASPRNGTRGVTMQ